MPKDEEWTIEFYIDEQGDSPVLEFLRQLDQKTKARFDWSIEQLRVRNIQAREPLVKHLEGKIWELRRESNKNIYRLLYFFFAGHKIIFVHGFQKKTQKTPHAEIAVAQKRMSDYIEREEEQEE